MAQLIARGIEKSYPTPAEPLRVLTGVDLTVQSGQSVSVVGPSGSGKSTLLAILGTLEAPTSGELTLAGQNPLGLGEPELAKFRREQIGFVFQDHHLLPQLTVLDNVLVPFLAEGRPGTNDTAWARELLERVGLTERLTHRPAELSGGERQRVAIARALVRRPKLLLADEPTGNLDGKSAHTVADLLIEMQRAAGAMLVVVTHSLSLAERLDRQTRMEAGRLVE